MRRLLLASLLLNTPLAAQAPATAPPEPPDTLPVDPAVTIGRLSNGLTYYVRENRHPQKRAELRLVVDAGSVLEDSDQLGLAHFVEHMAFNGTTHFEKKELIDFTQRIGMRIGADLNASTRFDETVYTLQVPTDSADLLAAGFQILADWAGGITFDPVEIEKERGVVIEEWRRGLGAQKRLTSELYPVLLQGSRYVERLPIGTLESLERFDHDALRRFYHDWYRPDLIAVVAVGDFDAGEAEHLIRQHFSDMPTPDTARPRPHHSIPPRDSTAVAVATDPEAIGTMTEVYFLRAGTRAQGTVDSYRGALVDRLYSTNLNNRLIELGRQPSSAFMAANVSIRPVVRDAEAFRLGVTVADTNLVRGLAAVLKEVERVEQHGFTEAELARAKRMLLRTYERAYAGRETTQSRRFAADYVQHFLAGEPVAGLAHELAVAERLMSEITLPEVNGAAGAWLGLENRVLLVSAPEKPDVVLPTPDSLLTLFEKVDGADIAPYEEDGASNAPLVAAALSEAAIVDEVVDSVIGVTTWRLANGVRVILKPTDFRADEVRFAASSPGGLSLVPDSLLASARAAAPVLAASGWGEFSLAELEKKLSGVVANIDGFIDAYEEGIRGSASPADIEMLFQLIYLHFTAPRADTAAFRAIMTKNRAALVNRSADPLMAFRDTVNAIMSQHHPRTRPLRMEQLDSIHLDDILAVYRDRFADANDFTFFLVGDFTLDSIRPLVSRYLGNLPAMQGTEALRDPGIELPTGIIEREMHRGLEPVAQTQIVFSGPLGSEYLRAERYVLYTVAEVLKIELQSVLREELGGTYNVAVRASPTRLPYPHYQFSIQFASAPERVDELVSEVFARIEDLRREGPDEVELAKVTEVARRGWETSLERNSFWLTFLHVTNQNGEDPRQMLSLEDELRRTVTPDDVRLAAEMYLNPQRFVRVTLLPGDDAAER